MELSLLCDLDGTILDTTGVQQLRDQRNWKACVAASERTEIFPGIKDALADLRNRGSKLAIVTSSVSYYAETLLAFHGIEYDVLIAYHDTTRHKPHPEPCQAALRALGCQANEAIGIGDKAEDQLALSACGLPAYAAGWSQDCETNAAWQGVLGDAAALIAVVDRFNRH